MFYRRSVAAVSILVVASALLTTTPLHAELQWMWESPLPQGNDILGAWGSSASDIFAVGEYGTTLHYDGSEWTIQPTGLQPPEKWYHLNAVWGTGPSNVWVVGNSGLILHYNGTTWASFPSGTDYSLNGIWGTSASNIYAVGEYGTIIRFNGASWTAVDHGGLTTRELFAVWGSSASDVHAVGGSMWSGGVALHWKNNSWTKESLPAAFNPPLHGVWGTGPDNVYAVGGAWLAGTEGPGKILRYDGISWFEMHSPSEFYMAGLWGVDADAAFAVGAAGRVMRLDAGLWETTDLGLLDSYHLFAVWGSSASDVWAFGVGGLIWHYDGISWTQDSTGLKNSIVSVWGTRPNDLYIIRREYNDGGFVSANLVEHFNGTYWTEVCESSPSLPLNAVWGSGPNDVYAVGGDGASAKIMHYDGDTCNIVHSAQTGPKSLEMNAVWGTGPDNVYAVGRAYILHYDGNASHTWTVVTTWAGTYRGLWGSGPNDIYASSDYKILHYDGGSWEESLSRTFPDPPINAVRGCGPGDVYAVGDHSTLLHLSGGTWTQDADFIAAFPDYKLEDVWCADPWNLFVFANSHGTIFHYDGFDWSAMFHSSFNLKAAWGNASDEVYAVGGRGKILRYGEGPLIFQDGFESGDTTAWNP